MTSLDPTEPGHLAGRLAALPTFRSVPRTELEWLAVRSEVRSYEAGATVIAAGSLTEEMMILLAGRIALRVPQGGTSRTVFIDTRAGDVLGVIPYSRVRTAPGQLVAEEEATTLAIHRDHFPELIRECPELTAALVHQMLDRSRAYNAVQLTTDRLQALGRLASGVAHELNNPAAGAFRAAQSLGTLLDGAERASRDLADAGLTHEQLTELDGLRSACAAPVTSRGTLEAADREEVFARWLRDHGADSAMAESLSRTSVSLDQLDRIAASGLTAGALDAGLRWVASGLAAREVADEVTQATQRIHDLVNAIKGFTFMDRHDVPEEIDVARGLADTITVLQAKADAADVEVRLEVADDLPKVFGFGAELNQIWEKLIDNAIDASEAGGRVLVEATAQADSVIVTVTDSGTGIPPENAVRIFDPFFTTKPIGEGAGLGLAMALRFVEIHGGRIDFVSRAGATTFTVGLPAAEARTTTPPTGPPDPERPRPQG